MPLTITSVDKSSTRIRVTCGVACPYGVPVVCTLAAGHDGEHEHRGHRAHTRWQGQARDLPGGFLAPGTPLGMSSALPADRWAGDTRMREVHDEQAARHEAMVASAKGTFARMYPGLAKWLPVDLDPPVESSDVGARWPGVDIEPTQREINGIVERINAAHPLPLDLAAVERLATKVAHAVNPAIAVCVDRKSSSPFGGEHALVVWLSLEGREKVRWISPSDSVDECRKRVRDSSHDLCTAVGRAYRSGGVFKRPKEPR